MPSAFQPKQWIFSDLVARLIAMGELTVSDPVRAWEEAASTLGERSLSAHAVSNWLRLLSFKGAPSSKVQERE